MLLNQCDGVSIYDWGYLIKPMNNSKIRNQKSSCIDLLLNGSQTVKAKQKYPNTLTVTSYTITFDFYLFSAKHSLDYMPYFTHGKRGKDQTGKICYGARIQSDL